MNKNLQNYCATIKKLILTSKILSIHVNFIFPNFSILSKTSIHSTCTVFSAGHGLVI